MSHLLNRWILATLCGAVAWSMPLTANAQPVTFKADGTKLAVLIGSDEFTTLNYGPDLPKPFFSPVKAKGGVIVTRSINDPDDKDHPHHKGIWLSVDEVNEVKFWAEKGRIVNVNVAHKSGSDLDPAGSLKLTNHWEDADGKPVVIENTTVTIHPNRLIAYDITFTPAVDKVVFEDTKEGLFGIRVATTMREKVGGVVVNAEGKKATKECWGQPSKWVDYSGDVNGQMYGVTMLDHPENFRPSRYHVRDYGLFSVSPFGEGSYQNDKAKAQPVTLEKGKPGLRIRYGLYIHQGTAETAKIDVVYKQFVEGTK